MQKGISEAMSDPLAPPTDREIVVAEAMQNHDKHYWGLVQWLKRKKKGWYELSEIIAEGSTVAKAIWAKHENFDWE